MPVKAHLLGGLIGAIVLITGLPSIVRADEACTAAYEKAQEKRLDGDLAAARSELLLCASPSCPALTTGDCTQWLREVEKELPNILLSVSERDGTTRTDATVTVDGNAAGVGQSTWLNPGDHVVRCERRGSWGTRTISVEKGAHGKAVLCELENVKAESAPVRTAPHERTGLPIGGFILGGVGLAAVIAGIAVAVHGISERADLKDTCYPHCPADRVSSVHTTLVASDVTVGLGLGAIGAGALWLILGRETKASSISFVPVAAPRGIGVGISIDL